MRTAPGRSNLKMGEACASPITEWRPPSTPEARQPLLEHTANGKRRDGEREPAGVVDVNAEAAQGGRSAGRLEAAGRNLGQEPAYRLLLVHAEHRIIIAAHAGIRLIGGAAGQDAAIRS